MTIQNSIGNVQLDVTNNLSDLTNVAAARANLGIASSYNFKGPVNYASSAALPACTYNNGSSGVGATLTANANGFLVVDGSGPNNGNLILVTQQIDARQNGLYVTTSNGGASSQWVLTRSTIYNTTAQINLGDLFNVTGGTQNRGVLLWQNGSSITIGTSSIVFVGIDAQFINGTSVAPASGASQVLMTTSSTAATWVATTGSGNVILSTSPTLVTPLLGTPTSAILTNCIGLPLTTGVAGILPEANGGTGTSNRTLKTSGAVTTLDWQNLLLNDFTGVLSIAYGSRGLQDLSANPSVNWGSRQTFDSAGNISQNWQSRLLVDSTVGSESSVDWSSRHLIASDGTTIGVDWSSPSGAKVNGVAITGTPSVGQVPVATSTTAATWQTVASPVATQEVYVSLQGNDTTGNGSATNPWLTFAHAQASISPTTTSRYTVWVAPGFYSENISLHANVFIVATAPVETRLTGNVDINNSSWNTPGVDNRSGFMDIELRTGTQTYDFTAQAGNDSGKLYFNNVRMGTQPVFTGLSTSEANQITLSNCYLFSGVSNSGAVVQITNSYNSGGTYQNHSSASASQISDMQILGGCNDGSYSNIWTSNSPATMEIEGVGFNATTTITTTGASATTTINGNSLPIRANVTTSGGGTLAVIGDSSSINANINFGRALSAQTLAASTGRRPSTSNDTFINFSATIVNVLALAASITLQTSPDNSTWTTIQSFAVPIITAGSIAPFGALLPAGYYYRWVSSASAGGANSISTIQELSL